MHQVTTLVVLLATGVGRRRAGPGNAVEVRSMLFRLVEQVDVPARETGVLAAVQVREGQMVQEGDCWRRSMTPRPDGGGAGTRPISDRAGQRHERRQPAFRPKSRWKWPRRNCGGPTIQRELRRGAFRTPRWTACVCWSRTAAWKWSSRNTSTRWPGLMLQAGKGSPLAQQKAQRHSALPAGRDRRPGYRIAASGSKPGEAVVRILRMDRLRAEGDLPALEPARIWRVSRCG